jgi:Na+-transporting NADH:ubiquinone oxidoreductase subunit C
MSADSTRKTIIVALGVCLVCSILVSTAAVALKGIQDENKQLDKIKNILIAGDLLKYGTTIQDTYENNIKGTFIDMTTGNLYDKELLPNGISIETFDLKAMAKDSDVGIRIPAEKDIAQIRRMPKYMTVYEVVNNGQVEKYILPVSGFGLWSTLYGFIAINKNLQTIEGITFYEHGETPGLGGEVDNPRWKAIWKGKQGLDDLGNVLITVIKGPVDPGSAKANVQIDGLSGSTLTTRGLDNLVKFWLGADGYGPFFNRLRQEG